MPIRISSFSFSPTLIPSDKKEKADLSKNNW